VLSDRAENRLSVYTQCAKCSTVFKLSAETLRAASGQVRCGKCGEIFNALANLAEDRSAFTTGHESSLALERRADSILEASASAAAPAPPADQSEEPVEPPPGVEIAHLEVIDIEIADFSVDPPLEQPEPPALMKPAETSDPAEQQPNSAAETSLEFTLPPGDLDRIFIEPKLPRLPILPPAESVEPQPAETEAEPAAIDSILRSTHNAPPRLWVVAAICLGLLLLAQIVHHNREWLGAHGPFASLLRAGYSSAGAPISQAANLSVYELRQFGATGDPASDGTLQVRASIMNTAPQFEPYPLLRVTLENRFGTRIGMRDFEAAEYVGRPVAGLLKPGERVDANVAVRDPGNDADSFEVDICLRNGDKKISCANDLLPTQGRR
jgi:predicted Zn finger-like uncharacterized protein